MSVLAFVFDHLLLGNNSNQGNGTPPIPKIARTFLQCLAAVQHPPDATMTLVTEFKLAFNRSLMLPESQLKHMRVRALTALLSQILDSQSSSLLNRAPVSPSHFSRLLIRKGFISDLARATHSLSLNSSHLIGTINNILKPLEVLTRIVNQVSGQRKVPPSTTSKLTASITRQASLSSQPRQQTSSSGAQEASGAAAESFGATGTSSQTDQTRSETLPESETNPETSRSQEERAVDTSFLEATHESLIPLEEEEDGEREQYEEIISLAHELGRQRREELTAAANSASMDIQVKQCFPQLHIQNQAPCLD